MGAPALADWQYTNWGMTPERVVAAAPVKVGPYADASLDTVDDTVRLVGNHEALGFKFAVAFMFDNRTNGLSRVKMLLSDVAQCDALKFKLSSIYGTPEMKPTMGVTRWRDEDHSNIVVLIPLGGCWLDYFPIPEKGASGL
jgi:hypothetical protein